MVPVWLLPFFAVSAALGMMKPGKGRGCLTP
jgi:hypothetical protein